MQGKIMSDYQSGNYVTKNLKIKKIPTLVSTGKDEFLYICYQKPYFLFDFDSQLEINEKRC